MEGENNVELNLGLSCGLNGMSVDLRGKNVISPCDWVDSGDKAGLSGNKSVKRKTPTSSKGLSKMQENKDGRECNMVDSTVVPFAAHMSNLMEPPNPMLGTANTSYSSTPSLTFGYSTLDLPLLDEGHIPNPDSSKHGETEMAKPVQRVGDTCDDGPIRAGISSTVRFGGCGSFPNLPWVSATGPGPKSRTISGVAYRKGEKIGIVCSCHSSHMTAEQFLEHAGEEM